MNKIFDFHTHIFPEKIAAKAVEGIGAFYDGMLMRKAGTASDLLAQLNQYGICGAMTCSVATSPEQAAVINDFIASAVSVSQVSQNSQAVLVGFAALHPDMTTDELERELERATALGLRGVKLHPDIQRFEADGERAFKVYEVLGRYELPMLIHAGDNRFAFSNPHRIANVAQAFPQQVIIAAHFGGWSEWDDAVLALADCRNVYVDTSSSLYAVTTEKASEMIAAFGEDRVLFGTDYPMWDAGEELQLIDKLNLSETAKAKILYDNAAELLKL